jgi:dTDP-4-amino-4,6-dideoxygalactose transaminase
LEQKIENDSRLLGTIFDFGFYSFGVMKNLCTFHGGAIICQRKNKFDEINNNIKNNIRLSIKL